MCSFQEPYQVNSGARLPWEQPIPVGVGISTLQGSRHWGAWQNVNGVCTRSMLSGHCHLSLSLTQHCCSLPRSAVSREVLADGYMGWETHKEEGEKHEEFLFFPALLPITIHTGEKYLEFHSLCSLCAHLVTIPDAKHTGVHTTGVGPCCREAVRQRRVALPLGPISKDRVHVVKHK